MAEPHTAVEILSGLGTIWHWMLGIVTTAGAWAWGHITGRVSKLEDTAIKREDFDRHVREEDEKLDTLFDKHDAVLDKVSSIQSSVARIEGKIGNGH